MEPVIDPRVTRLVAAAERRGIVVPQVRTTSYYGLSTRDWLEILRDQGWVCAICKRVPSTGRLVTDHEHVPGWSKMPADRRALYVRGVLCWYDNRYWLAQGMTPDRAAAIEKYLRRHEARRP